MELLSATDLRYECPVCLTHILPPVFQCVNGHLICKDCRPLLSICPSCREPMSIPVRNLEVEKIIKLLSHPCPYEDKGCDARLKYDEITDHMFDCSLGSAKVCAIVDLHGCGSDLVAFSQLSDHLRNAHKLVIEPSHGSFGVPYERNILFVVPSDGTKLSSIVCGSIQHENRDVIFLVNVIKCRREMVWQVFVLRGKSFARQCRFEITIRDDSGMPRLTWNGPCLSLQRTQRDLQASLVISTDYLKELCIKEDDTVYLNMLWKLTIVREQTGESSPGRDLSGCTIPPSKP